MRNAVCVCAVLLGLLMTAPTAAAQGVPDTFGEVDRFVADQARELRIPGVALSVVRGEEVHVRAFGAGITPDSRFAIGSESKAFAAFAALQLVEAGRLELDRPVVEYLPELRSTDPRLADLTTDMLLRMTGGLSDLDYPAMEPDDDLAAAVTSIEDLTFLATPGQGRPYSNINYFLLARVVEVAAGVGYDEYLRTRVLEPLGMSSTTTFRGGGELTGANLPELARGHTQVLGVPFPWPEPDVVHVGAGDVVSSATDMARWLQVGLGDTGGLLAPELLEETRRPLDLAVSDYSAGRQTYPPTDRLPERLYGGGDLPTYHTDVILLPEADLAVSVIINTNLLFPPVRMPFVYKEIATGVTDILLGNAPNSSVDPIAAGGDTPLLRWGSDVVPLAVVAASVLGTVRGVRRAPRRARRWGVWLLMVVPLALWGGFSMLAGVPVPLGYLFVSWPSAVVAAFAPAVAAVVIGVARARQRRAPTPQAAG